MDESAIGLAAFPALLISFNYPQLGKTMDNRYILYILFRTIKTIIYSNKNYVRRY
nr:MAG TPA: hypothetical protein [Bacteriophage sp.]